jgi:hypothetical protein
VVAAAAGNDGGPGRQVLLDLFLGDDHAAADYAAAASSSAAADGRRRSISPAGRTGQLRGASPARRSPSPARRPSSPGRRSSSPARRASMAPRIMLDPPALPPPRSPPARRRPGTPSSTPAAAAAAGLWGDGANDEEEEEGADDLWESDGVPAALFRRLAGRPDRGGADAAVAGRFLPAGEPATLRLCGLRRLADECVRHAARRARGNPLALAGLSLRGGGGGGGVGPAAEPTAAAVVGALLPALAPLRLLDLSGCAQARPSHGPAHVPCGTAPSRPLRRHAPLNPRAAFRTSLRGASFRSRPWRRRPRRIPSPAVTPPRQRPAGGPAGRRAGGRRVAVGVKKKQRRPLVCYGFLDRGTVGSVVALFLSLSLSIYVSIYI